MNHHKRLFGSSSALRLLAALAFVSLCLLLSLRSLATGHTPTAAQSTAIPKASLADARTIIAYNALNAPNVDGDLTEWLLLPTTMLNSVTADTTQGEPTTLADASAEIRIAWSQAMLYVAVLVSDNQIFTDSAKVWWDDGVELGIDGDFNRRGGDSTDHQYTLVADGRLTEFGNPYSGGLLAVRRLPTGYSMEFAIPAANVIQCNFVSAQTMGFT